MGFKKCNPCIHHSKQDNEEFWLNKGNFLILFFNLEIYKKKIITCTYYRNTNPYKSIYEQKTNVKNNANINITTASQRGIVPEKLINNNISELKKKSKTYFYMARYGYRLDYPRK